MAGAALCGSSWDLQEASGTESAPSVSSGLRIFSSPSAMRGRSSTSSAALAANASFICRPRFRVADVPNRDDFSNRVRAGGIADADFFDNVDEVRRAIPS
ncbi:MAG: hypothetical protein AAGE01_12795 [Pseudomonadota bacterium]